MGFNKKLLNLFKSKDSNRQEFVKFVADYMSKQGLFDLQNTPRFKDVKNISASLTKANLLQSQIDQGLGVEKDYIKAQLKNQKTIVEQNFVIIKQLEELLKK